jgi:hypothetical protein
MQSLLENGYWILLGGELDQETDWQSFPKGSVCAEFARVLTAKNKGSRSCLVVFD